MPRSKDYGCGFPENELIYYHLHNAPNNVCFVVRVFIGADVIGLCLDTLFTYGLTFKVVGYKNKGLRRML